MRSDSINSLKMCYYVEIYYAHILKMGWVNLLDSLIVYTTHKTFQSENVLVVLRRSSGGQGLLLMFRYFKLYTKVWCTEKEGNYDF